MTLPFSISLTPPVISLCTWISLLLWPHGSSHTPAAADAHVPGAQRVVSQPHTGDQSTSHQTSLWIDIWGTKVFWASSAGGPPCGIQWLLTLWRHGAL